MMSPVTTEPIMLNATYLEAAPDLFARTFQKDPRMVYSVPDPTSADACSQHFSA